MFTKRRIVWLTRLLIIVLILLAGLPLQAKAQFSVGTLCGQYLISTSEAATDNSFSFEAYFFITADKAFGFSQQPPFSEGYYRLHDVEVDAVAPGWNFNGAYVGDAITRWSDYEKLDRLSDCDARPTELPPTAIPPTRVPPTPLPTDAPLPTEPPNPPTPVPPISTPPPQVCGLNTTANIQSGMTGYTQEVLIPCGSDQLIAVGPLGGWGDDQYYCYSDPKIEKVQPQETSLGVIETQLTGELNNSRIDSCKNIGQADPVVLKKDNVVIQKLDWQSEPRAFTPATLLLNVEGQGNNIQAEPYILEITLGEDFPYKNIHYVFDSENVESAAHLSPSTLREGKFSLQVRNLIFPTTYKGSIHVTIYLKKTPDARSSMAMNTGIASSPNSSYHCASLLLNAGSSVVGSSAYETATIKYLQTQLNIIEICKDDTACQQDQIAQLHEELLTSPIETVAQLDPIGNLLLGIKEQIETGIEGAKCGQYFIEYTNKLLNQYNAKGVAVSGFLTASPVYPMITDSAGQRSGFLTDGTTIQEIPGAQIIQIEEKRLILIPGNSPVELAVAGYDQGTMSLYVTLPNIKGGDTSIVYKDVPVQPETQMELKPQDAKHTLVITNSEKVEKRLPDQITETKPDAEQTSTHPSPMSSLFSKPGQYLILLFTVGGVILLIMISGAAAVLYWQKGKLSRVSIAIFFCMGILILCLLGSICVVLTYQTMRSQANTTAPQPTVTQIITRLAAPMNALVQPTSTPFPTHTVEAPTYTPYPTYTPQPTYTRQPTYTLQATNPPAASQPSQAPAGGGEVKFNSITFTPERPSCGRDKLVINAEVSKPSEVSYIMVAYRLQDEDHTTTSEPYYLPNLSYKGGTKYSLTQDTCSLPHVPNWSKAWMYFQFIIVTQSGQQIKEFPQPIFADF